MIEVYLNFNGQAEEAARFYAQAFGAPAPYLMRFADMPQENQQQAPPSMEQLLMYGNVKTFAGDIMLSDNIPGQEVLPNSAYWITVSHPDEHQLRQVFAALSEGGEVLMPLETTFFSPLYGQLKDRYGFHWMLMLPYQP